MESKKSFGQRLEAVFAGKGFYIVLFTCVAVIGVSAWVMLVGTGTNVEDLSAIDSDLAISVMNEEPTATVKEPVAEPPKQVQQLEAEPEESIQVSVPAAEPEQVIGAFFVWPLTGEIELPYSVDALVYNRTMGDWRTHEGVDLAAAQGTQVMACASGMVEAVYNDEMYGTTVVLNHGGGLCSSYSNLAATPTVYVGDGVVAGEILGSVGDTALCESGEVNHLHFVMSLDGVPVDPADYMPER